MTFENFFRVLRGGWLIVLCAVLLAVAAAVSLYFLRPKMYTANTIVYVSATTDGRDSAESAFQGGQLAQQRAKSYVQLVRSTRVTGQVAKDLGLSSSPEDLAAMVRASNAEDSVVIEIEATDQSPTQAAMIANTTAHALISLADSLERSNPTAVAPVEVRVLQSAEDPETPSSTGLLGTIGLGLLAGLTVGVGGAMAREALDARIKSPADLHGGIGATHLGVVPLSARSGDVGIEIVEDPSGPTAESFRRMRTKLQHLGTVPRKTIVVTSALPFEGKTTVVVNLAAALAAANERVILVEADLRHPRLASKVRSENAFGITDVLAGRIKLGDAIVSSPDVKLDVLASGPLPENPGEVVASAAMEKLLNDLKSDYDTVLIDTSPVLPVADPMALAPVADAVILVCRADSTKKSDASSAIELLDSVGAAILGTVLTTARPAILPDYKKRYESRTTSAANRTSDSSKDASDVRSIENQENGLVDLRTKYAMPIDRR